MPWHSGPLADCCLPNLIENFNAILVRSPGHSIRYQRLVTCSDMNLQFFFFLKRISRLFSGCWVSLPSFIPLLLLLLLTRSSRESNIHPPAMGLIRTTAAASTRHRAELDIKNNAELHANAHSILATIHKAWPKNTCEAYGPKQKKFKVGR